jgi:hypothetical protein
MKPVQVRRPQHVGEHVEVEPLAKFLKRKIRVKPDAEVPAAPKREGWQG